MYYGFENLCSSDDISHHGIKGQKWGIRRYQNPDGTLTTAGRNRYGKVIKKGTTFRRVSTNKEETMRDETYVSYKKHDYKNYKKNFYDKYVEWSGDHEKLYKIRYNAIEDLLGPKKEEQVEVYMKRIKEEPELLVKMANQRRIADITYNPFKTEDEWFDKIEKNPNKYSDFWHYSKDKYDVSRRLREDGRKLTINGKTAAYNIGNIIDYTNEQYMKNYSTLKGLKNEGFKDYIHYIGGSDDEMKKYANEFRKRGYDYFIDYNDKKGFLGGRTGTIFKYPAIAPIVIINKDKVIKVDDFVIDKSTIKINDIKLEKKYE